ncbi:DNA polymerase beta-like [Anthonomus grandis grandis]|uniref:DNA polymerase beta-like n=1 Tax=Anthonomus grandis grandis TaxID=2921223 RepID=UPI00216643E2|nr:DNA polymerase beta-like [Anthonomus grandis grandis]
MSKRKAPSEESNPNHDFCEFLTELAEYEKNVTGHIHKYKVYRKAASVLAAHPTRITSGAEAKKLQGIGDKISKKIDEFLQTGKLQKLDNIHHDKESQAIQELTRVSGIGRAKAKKLYEEGISSIEELKKHTNQLTHHQIVGLKYVNDFEQKIPREEIEKIEKVLVKTIKNLDKEYDVTICGSYRRGKACSGDIDVLITHPHYKSDRIDKDKKSKTHNHILKEVVEALENCGLVTETLSLGDSKFMGACQLSADLPTRRLDIRFQPYDQYYCSILHFTGSDIFNQDMRAFALEQGFTLNEYTLRPLGSTGVPGEPVEICSEKDIFDSIGYPYKEPKDREG